MQLLADDGGEPLWTSPADPGPVSDITAARLHVLPLLRQAAKQGLTAFADLGYEGAGAGVHVPVKRPKDVAPERFSADNRPPTCCYAACAPSASARSPCSSGGGACRAAPPRAPPGSAIS
nr:transposase family protein [Nocardiopsis baichengensis]